LVECCCATFIGHRANEFFPHPQNPRVYTCPSRLVFVLSSSPVTLILHKVYPPRMSCAAPPPERKSVLGHGWCLWLVPVTVQMPTHAGFLCVPAGSYPCFPPGNPDTRAPLMTRFLYCVFRVPHEIDFRIFYAVESALSLRLHPISDPLYWPTPDRAVSERLTPYFTGAVRSPFPPTSTVWLTN